MNSERFEETCAAAAEIDANQSREILELTLDELNYVAGGIDSWSWG